MCSPSQILLETSLFTALLLVFTGHEVCNVTNKNQPPSNLAKYQYFYATGLIISFLHFKKKNAKAFYIAFIFRNICFTTFLLFLKVSEVCNISCKCCLSNKRHLTPLLYFEKIFGFSIAESFRNIHFSPHLY